jgi:hypothetical protein
MSIFESAVNVLLYMGAIEVSDGSFLNWQLE